MQCWQVLFFKILPTAWVSQSPCIGESLLTSLFIIIFLIILSFISHDVTCEPVNLLISRKGLPKNFLQKSHYAAENSISEHLNIKIFWGSMLPDPH